jgi:hypothetical protein
MADWKEVFADSGAVNWQENWSLDGLTATVTNTPDGVILKAGPVHRKSSDNTVLWTKQSFKGDLRIEYDFTRLDNNPTDSGVCILYIEATGTGKGPYTENIMDWKNLRTSPDMSIYFNNMNCYHISYSCLGGKDYADFNYVRARRYPSLHGHFGPDTAIPPSYDHVDLFHPGEKWHLVFLKEGTQLSMTATLGAEKHVWTWDTSKYPPITHGNIGLREMASREALYGNFKVYQKE